MDNLLHETEERGGIKAGSIRGIILVNLTKEKKQKKKYWKK